MHKHSHVPLTVGTTFTNLIQVAGVHNLQEAQMLINHGVHAIGFPLRLPVNAEDLTEAEAASVAQTIRSTATPVAITYLDTANDIISFCNAVGMNHIQLHGSISLPELQTLRDKAPDLFIIKSLVVLMDGSNEKVLQQAVQQFSPYVDAFITDTHNPETGADGATGKTHDWHISARLVTASEKPVILAGGLTPENVHDAVIQVAPAGVDAHTGLEGSDGLKDPEQVSSFVQQANKAFATLSCSQK